MLMSAYRPCRQLPDASFADVAASPIATCRWGDIGAACARSLADTLRCVVRTAPGLCFRRAWGKREQRGRVLSLDAAVHGLCEQHAHVLSLYAAAHGLCDQRGRGLSVVRGCSI